MLVNIVLHHSIYFFFQKSKLCELYQVVRGPWKLPNITHCNFLSTINSSLHIEIALEKRCAKFIHSCLNSNNLIIKTISIFAITTHRSQFGGFVINTRFQDIYVLYQLVIYYSIFKISLPNMLVFRMKAL